MNLVREEKREAMMAGYSFITTNPAVKEHLKTSIAMIYRHLFFALHGGNSSVDVLGNFYGEFLRYSGGDKQGLGIVLTPRHITELFSDLADLNPERSVVLDICTGSGGFLISAMAKMITDAKGDSRTISRIKNEGLIGIELDPQMFTLACANMIFRGDGKANMFHDDCLKPRDPETERRVVEARPNVALLNPPYSKKAEGKQELTFVKRALDLLQPGGIGIAIIPIGSISSDSKEVAEIKRQILEQHTLKATMSMPPSLFPGVGTVTAIVVFEAHRPHLRYKTEPAVNKAGKALVDKDGQPVTRRVAEAKTETWFAYWRDDGFETSKGKRVERQPGIWETTKTAWLDAFTHRRTKEFESVLVSVTDASEWVVEAYLTTDYSRVTRADLEQDLRRTVLFDMMLELRGADGDPEEDEDAA